MKSKDFLNRILSHYSDHEILQITQAVEFATEVHRGQKRASGEPYITHPLAVATILVDWELDASTITAGILHDTVEDGDITLHAIEEKFGEDVAFLVDGVTKVGVARAGMADISTYLPQTKDNLSKLLIAVSHDLRVLLIKLADRLHNLQTLQYLPIDKQQKIARESLEVFAPLADRLGIGRLRVQLEELSFSFLEPSEYKRLQKTVKKRLGKSHRKLVHVREEVKKALDALGIEHQIDGRIKSIYSLYKKLRKVDGNIDQIYDLMALRIIVDTKEQCYQVLGVLHSLYQPMLNKIKDYIAVPKPNGYQSLHTTVITPNEEIVEFQIRTTRMHELAERGLAASFHYNEQKMTKHYQRRAVTTQLPRNLEWITQLQALTDKLASGEAVSGGELNVDLFSDRIFVYSPKGDIYDLPEGAYPLDFAFMVHSDIALRAHSFKVNGNISPFDKPLQNGDIIYIETKRNVRPKADWLEHVKTARARQKIKSYLTKKA